MFKHGEFVQIEKQIRLKDGQVLLTWANALYKDCYGGCHAITWADGQCEVLNKQTKIRKVKIGK